MFGKVDVLAENIVKTLRYHGARALESVRGLAWAALGPFEPRAPVFVVGCSRAGTTMVYKTLSEAQELGSLQRETHDDWANLHPPVERGWESHEIPLGARSDNDRAAISRLFFVKTGRHSFVDKNNQNGLSVPYLASLFPDARFVYAKRAPGDNLNSLIEGWRRPEEFGTWSGSLPLPVRIDGGQIDRWCFFLPKDWRDLVEAPLEVVCARQYAGMNAAIMDARDCVPSAQWFELRYEDVLRDPLESFAPLFEGLGLELGPRIRKHCETLLDNPYNAFSEIRAHKWLSGRNRERIERVIGQVEAVARRMGYQV